jgi:NAD(P)-dependent dehydrogenase (short-subunit alcohol dehydrogenase family)
MGRLDGSVAVITGAVSGMGEATAPTFAPEGARVVIGDRQLEKGNAVARSPGRGCMFAGVDVRVSGTVRSLVTTATQRFGRLDITYNNAGIAFGDGRIADTPGDVFDRTCAISVDGGLVPSARPPVPIQPR